MEGPEFPPVNIASRSSNRPRHAVIAIAVVVVVGLLLYWAALAALKGVIASVGTNMLRREFASDVRFQKMDISVFPRVHVVAYGVSIGNDVSHPLIEASQADARCGWIPWQVRTVILEGLQVRIPVASAPPPTNANPHPAITVDEVFASRASVELPALHFDLRDLHVSNFTPNSPAAFAATLNNSEPRAEVQISGKLGPWNATDPGRTPVEGKYNLARSDLATLPGLRGIVSSQGRFNGVLLNATISGDAHVDGFGISTSGHAEAVRASFQAVLDGSDGSASVDRITGALEQSPFVGSGSVHDLQDDRRRQIALQVSMAHGRLEDLLPLGVTSKVSPLTGPLSVQAKVEIPPGEQDLLSRLHLSASFSADGARFASWNLRERLRSLSRKAEGEPNNDAAGSSISSMQGEVRLDRGVAHFSSLAIELEGASAKLEGSYQLANEQLDLHGDVWMEAKVSQTATGPKALLLKLADPFFKSKHGGSHVPIKITGTRSDPKFAVDMARKATASLDSRAVLFSH